MTNEEKQICDSVISMLSKNRDAGKFGIEERTSSYVSLIYCDNDFFRIKFTERSQWLSIRLAKEDMDKDDPRFSAQTNKNQLHWKANIESMDDVKLFKKELLNACKSLNGDTYEPRGNINKGKITLGFDFGLGSFFNKERKVEKEEDKD